MCKYINIYIYVNAYMGVHAFKHTHKEISVRLLGEQKDKEAAKHEEPKASTQSNCFSESLPSFSTTKSAPPGQKNQPEAAVKSATAEQRQTTTDREVKCIRQAVNWLVHIANRVLLWWVL